MIRHLWSGTRGQASVSTDSAREKMDSATSGRVEAFVSMDRRRGFFEDEAMVRTLAASVFRARCGIPADSTVNAIECCPAAPLCSDMADPLDTTEPGPLLV